MSEQKTKVFIDLDDTLFDTKAFKQALFGLFVGQIEKGNRAIRIDDVVSHYQRFRDENNFTPQALIDSFGFDEARSKTLNDQVETLMQNLKPFFNSSMFSKIQERFPRSDYRLILFTLGDPEVQRQKVEACGIDAEFDEYVFVPSDKVGEFAKYVTPEEEFNVVDDRTDVLEALRNKYPKARLFHTMPGSDDFSPYSEEIRENYQDDQRHSSPEQLDK